MRRPVFGLIAAFLACSHGLAGESFLVDTWSGSSYFDDTSGKFTKCAAYSPYPGGISLSLSVDRYYNWAFGFGHPQWQMTGSVVPVIYRFDDDPWVSGRGLVTGPKFLFLQLPVGANLPNFLMHKDVMEIQFNGDEFYLKLADFPSVLSKLASCYRQRAVAPRPYIVPECRMRNLPCKTKR